MGFLSDNVILTGPGGCLELDSGQWCALLNLGMIPEPDQSGRSLPSGQWKQDLMFAALDDERLPVVFSAEQARTFADALEYSSASIPESAEFGKLLTTREVEVGGEWKKYAVTSRKGWVETDDVELLFLEDGKEIIHRTIELLRSGPVTIELAARADQAGR